MLNRAQWKQYSDSTPWVNFTYDPAVPNGMGQLGSVANAYSVTNFTSFDAAGRILGSNQVTGGRKYSFSYGYNLAGSLTSETYPSGRVVSTGYDGANRPSTVTGNLNGQQSNYVTQTAYWPQGDIYYFTRGNGLWHAAGYNSLLQPTEMYESLNNVNSTSNMLLISCLNWGSSRNFGGSLYNVCPAAPSAKNNGTLQSYTVMNGGPGSSQFVTFNQTFGYDNANRLISATDSGGWSRNFGYDAYGNMWVSGFTGIIPAGNAPQNQNQFTGTTRRCMDPGPMAIGAEQGDLVTRSIRMIGPVWCMITVTRKGALPQETTSVNCRLAEPQHCRAVIKHFAIRKTERADSQAGRSKRFLPGYRG